MTLQQILKDAAARMIGVTVKVDTRMGTVCISDDKGVQDDIFMQGDDAEKFIKEREDCYLKTGNLTVELIDLTLAEPYVDCLWN